jgi:hypothetical protein
MSGIYLYVRTEPTVAPLLEMCNSWVVCMLAGSEKGGSPFSLEQTLRFWDVLIYYYSLPSPEKKFIADPLYHIVIHEKIML